MSTGGLDSMPLSFLNSMCRPGEWGVERSHSELGMQIWEQKE